MTKCRKCGASYDAAGLRNGVCLGCLIETVLNCPHEAAVTTRAAAETIEDALAGRSFVIGHWRRAERRWGPVDESETPYCVPDAGIGIMAGDVDMIRASFVRRDYEGMQHWLKRVSGGCVAMLVWLGTAPGMRGTGSAIPNEAVGKVIPADTPASMTVQEMDEIERRYSAALDAKPSKGPVSEDGIDALADSVCDIPVLLAEIRRLKGDEA